MYDIEKDVENVAKAIADSFAVPTPAIYFKETARAAINASSAVKELKELQERYDALAKDEWVDINDKLPEKQELNYLVLSNNHGYQIGYYTPPFKGFEPKFDVPNVLYWKPLTPPKKD